MTYDVFGGTLNLTQLQLFPPLETCLFTVNFTTTYKHRAGTRNAIQIKRIFKKN